MFNKTLCSLLVLLLPVLGGGILASITPMRVEAANTAGATCGRYYQGHEKDVCVIGYNGGYKANSLIESCGTVGQPIKGINYGTNDTSVCAAGHDYGSRQRVSDKVPTPKPSGTTLANRAQIACTEEYGKTGDKAEACQRGYKAAYAADATSDSVTKECQKEKNDQLKEACRKGVSLADRDNVEINTTKKPPAEEEAAANANKAAEEDSCDTTGSPLSWIICPIIDLGAKFTDFVFNDIVRPFLEDVPISSNPDDPGYNAWKQFRLLGNIVLIGTMLAVVYAQARGDR